MECVVAKLQGDRSVHHPPDETLELPSAYSGQLSFAAETGTLKLDNSASFGGTVAGMTGEAVEYRCFED
jgi:hypothetical protein